jgi:hypothetical protein
VLENARVVRAFTNLGGSLIVLTPPDPGAHPYSYWKNHFGEMWIADYLCSEGFDATRVSVYGTQRVQSVENLLKSLDEFGMGTKTVRATAVILGVRLRSRADTVPAGLVFEG